MQRSTLSLEEKHPIILPNQYPVTELLVLMDHEREGHMGCSQVFTAMYKQYWILSGSVESDAPFDVFIKADGYWHWWRKTQYLADLFRERWTNQYLPLLQPRHKWFGAVPSLKPGDLVLIVDESTKRGHWPKAIVKEVMPDSNHLVRRVLVRTADGSEFVRDIRKLCLLEGHVNP